MYIAGSCSSASESSNTSESLTLSLQVSRRARHALLDRMLPQLVRGVLCARVYVLSLFSGVSGEHS
jgi:hypothetical protein